MYNIDPILFEIMELNYQDAIQDANETFIMEQIRAEVWSIYNNLNKQIFKGNIPRIGAVTVGSTTFNWKLEIGEENYNFFFGIEKNGTIVEYNESGTVKNGVLNPSNISIRSNTNMNATSLLVWLRGVGVGLQSDIEKGVKPIVDRSTEFNKNIQQQKQLFSSARKAVDAVFPAGVNYLGRIAVFGYIQWQMKGTDLINPKQLDINRKDATYYGEKWAGDDFGNFAYGIAAREMGISWFVALCGAGAYSSYNHITNNNWGAIQKSNPFCLGDEWKDSYYIFRGYMTGGYKK